MKRAILLALGMLIWSTMVKGQPAPSGDIQTFELRAVAPPVPALKYQLVFDSVDSTPGNAAMAYTQAALLLDKDAAADIDKAMHAGDADFDALAQLIYTKSERVFAALEVAGRCEGCDWQVSYDPDQIQANTTQVRALRMLANLIQIRAKQQIRAGKIDEALAALRLGYELSDRTARRPQYISALVAVAMTLVMDDQMAELMKRPDSPNLYWALINLPHPKDEIRISLAGERKFALRHGSGGGGILPPDALKAIQEESRNKDFSQLTDDARAYYAKSRNISLDAVKKLDVTMVIDTYEYEQYAQEYDDWYKLLGLPYREMMLQMRELVKKSAAGPAPAGRPAVLGRSLVPSMIRSMEGLGRLERKTAALTAVEAIRSYAAANDGKLPAHLEDITETPAPLNPLTDRSFEYHVDGGVATLSDPQPMDHPLIYTIRVRK